MRVLVAEDCPDSLSLLAEVFRTLGHDVITATDGAQAVRLAVEHSP